VAVGEAFKKSGALAFHRASPRSGWQYTASLPCWWGGTSARGFVAGLFPVCLWIIMILYPASRAQGAEGLAIDLNETRARWIGERVFANECNLNVRCLTSWNEGEDFPSLGIGHFIWYRTGQQERFEESFPALLAFYQLRGVELPPWLAALAPPDQPWPDRRAFLADLHGPRLSTLRDFLNDTRDVQARFIIRRLEQALPTMMAHTDEPDAVRELFHQVASARSPHGLYALIDYVNFKGEGIAVSERYRGQGWGLLQVLEYMHDNPEPAPVLLRFSKAAAAVLRRRVDNAPPERNESRWLAGWNNRVATYWPETNGSQQR